MSKDERLGPCPTCGANMDLVGRRHKCRPAPSTIAEDMGRAWDHINAVEAAEEPAPKTSNMLRDVSKLVKKRRPLASEEVKRVAATALKQAPVRDKTPADLQAEVDQVAAKGRPDGKKSIWVSGKQAHMLKVAAAKHEVTQETIVAEGIAVMLEGKYK